MPQIKQSNFHYNQIQYSSSSSAKQLIENIEKAKNSLSYFYCIGDEELQNGVFVNSVIEHFSSSGYNTHPGFIFPNSTAQVYSNAVVQFAHQGNWIYAKNTEIVPELPIGIAGMASRTEEATASFSINLNHFKKSKINKIRLFCKKGKKIFTISLKTGNENYKIKTDENTALPFIDINLNHNTEKIEFQFIKENNFQTEFEIYGMVAYSESAIGIVPMNSGTQGGAITFWNDDNVQLSQMSKCLPNIVVLDLGFYDLVRLKKNKYELEDLFISKINKLRKINPHVSIILCSGLPKLGGAGNNQKALELAGILQSLAKEMDCLFWDWYWISGGRKALTNWKDSELASGEILKLNYAGLRTKGTLFFKAIEQLLEANNQNNLPNFVHFNTDTLIHPRVDSVKVAAEQARLAQLRLAQEQQKLNTYKWFYHKVTRGQTIWSIATYYQVTAYQIVVWNKMKNYYVYIGQNLAIYSKVSPDNKINPAIQPQKPKETVIPKPRYTPPSKTPTPSSTNVKPKQAYHTIKKGETMYSVAVKYGTTVAQIQKLNNLKNGNVKIGQVLRVK